jgi:hypothetical protein
MPGTRGPFPLGKKSCNRTDRITPPTPQPGLDRWDRPTHTPTNSQKQRLPEPLLDENPDRYCMFPLK